jgi:hypothetical protein
MMIWKMILKRICINQRRHTRRLSNPPAMPLLQVRAKSTVSHEFASNTYIEALRKQIEAAHRAHLQSQFSMNDGHVPAFSLEASHQKVKNPVNLDLERTSIGTSVPEKGRVTYAKRPNDIFNISPTCQLKVWSSLQQAPQPADTTNETDWMLEGTMREAYAQIDPNTMFPEPSSTVPNATLTQQRVLEGVLAPALLGSDTDTGGAPFQPDASIPWSEYLKSPTNTGEQPKSSAQGLYISQATPAAISGPSLQGYSRLTQSKRSRQESLMLVGSPSMHSISPTEIDTQELAMFPNSDLKPNDIQLQTALSSRLKGTPQNRLHNSHCLPRKKSQSPVPTSDDDLADLGLPQEQ